MSKSFEKLNALNIIEKTDNSVSLLFSVPKENAYFDGHFPGYPILPAVAQMELVVRFADRFFETGIAVSQIKRMKFSKIINPESLLLLKIDIKTNLVNYVITTPEGNETYSNGSIIFPAQDKAENA